MRKKCCYVQHIKLYKVHVCISNFKKYMYVHQTSSLRNKDNLKVFLYNLLRGILRISIKAFILPSGSGSWDFRYTGSSVMCLFSINGSRGTIISLVEHKPLLSTILIGSWAVSTILSILMLPTGLWVLSTTSAFNGMKFSLFGLNISLCVSDCSLPILFTFPMNCTCNYGRKKIISMTVHRLAGEAQEGKPLPHSHIHQLHYSFQGV